MGIYKKIKQLAEEGHGPSKKLAEALLHPDDGTFTCGECEREFKIEKLHAMQPSSGELFCRKCGSELKKLFGEEGI